MSERETREITTPSGTKIVIKTYLTGREYREIEKIYLSAVNYDPNLRQTTTKFDAETIQSAENESFKQYIVSVDGKTEGILDIILDLKSEDFDFVKKEIQNQSILEGKKKPQS